MFTQKYKRNKVFNKDFYRMLANIKDYQSKTASQHSPSQNSPSYCT